MITLNGSDTSATTQVVIPFTSIIGGTDATNNAKSNPHGGYFSRLDNIKQYGYPFPQYHKNQLGDTALGNDGVFHDTKPDVRMACIAPGHDGRTHTNEIFKQWLVATVRWVAQPAR